MGNPESESQLHNTSTSANEPGKSANTTKRAKLTQNAQKKFQDNWMKEFPWVEKHSSPLKAR